MKRSKRVRRSNVRSFDGREREEINFLPRKLLSFFRAPVARRDTRLAINRDASLSPATQPRRRRWPLTFDVQPSKPNFESLIDPFWPVQIRCEGAYQEEHDGSLLPGPISGLFRPRSQCPLLRARPNVRRRSLLVHYTTA